MVEKMRLKVSSGHLRGELQGETREGRRIVSAVLFCVANQYLNGQNLVLVFRQCQGRLPAAMGEEINAKSLIGATVNDFFLQIHHTSRPAMPNLYAAPSPRAFRISLKQVLL
jgi:hypothetical protein